MTVLQRRVLVRLAGMEPPWTLTGGAALVGVHLGHRDTRDLDLFFHGESSVAGLRGEAEARLQTDGLLVQSVQTASAFQQLRVSDGAEVVIVDLVADRVPTVEAPTTTAFEGVAILVDTKHEILVNKLCALLGRSEARDLVDVRALLGAGLDLERALRDAPAKDGGFSPLTLCWVLRQPSMTSALGAVTIEGATRDELLEFRDALIARVMRAAAPPAT